MTNESMQIRATRVRQMWMRNMGISERDIQYYIECDPPTSVAEERAQLYASWRINRQGPKTTPEPTVTESKTSSPDNTLGLLGVAFIILKLCEVIDWPWWAVTIPFWGPLAFVVVVFAVWGLWAVLTHFLTNKGR